MSAEKYIFVLMGVLIVSTLITLFPNPYFNGESVISSKVVDTVEFNVAATSADEYYEMFKCLCCGQSIAAECCGMATQLVEYVDELLADGLSGEEIVLSVVKQHGFDVLMDSSMEDEIRNYILSNAPDNPPVIYFESERYDFGTIKQSDGVVTTSFTILNTGGNDLIIENLDTSCMCTEASLIYDGVESPKFGMSMHGDNPKDFKLVIPPGGSAELKVYFDPNAHGEQTEPELKITREVTIVSNDPIDFQTKVRIELTQIP